MPNRRRSHQQFFVVLCLFLSTTGILFGLDNLLSTNTTPDNLVTSASADGVAVTATSLPSVTTVPTKSANLQQVVQNQLRNTNGKYAVVVKSLSSDETYATNENVSFNAASLYKLWVMAKVYDDIEQGKIDEDDTLESSIPALNQEFGIASESAEKTDGQLSMTIKQALTLMITQSDNYAAYLLSDKVTLSKVQAYLSAKGFGNSYLGLTGGLPTTTASDIALFYEKLYNGQLGNAESTSEMINLLKAQQRNGKIPKYLPDSIDVAHKTGELDTVSHDAGIIYTPSGNYILVVLSDTNNPPSAVEKIATISKAVYDYFGSN